MKIVVVTWGDAWSNTTGRYSSKEFEKYNKPLMNMNCGWVLSENEKGILLGSCYIPEEEDVTEEYYKEVFHIPKGMIQSIEVIKEECNCDTR